MHREAAGLVRLHLLSLLHLFLPTVNEKGQKKKKDTEKKITVADAEPKNNIEAKLQQMSESRLLTPSISPRRWCSAIFIR